MSGFNSHHSKNIITVAGRVQGTGTAAVVAGKDFYIHDRGTGLYGLTFPRSYVKLISFVATSETNDNVCVFDTTDFTDGTVDTTDTATAVAHDSTTLIVPGMPVSGAGIPTDAYVVSITSATAFEMSAAATATATNITLTLTPHNVQANSTLICVRTEAIDETAALVDANFSFIACFETAGS